MEKKYCISTILIGLALGIVFMPIISTIILSEGTYIGRNFHFGTMFGGLIILIIAALLIRNWIFTEFGLVAFLLSTIGGYTVENIFCGCMSIFACNSAIPPLITLCSSMMLVSVGVVRIHYEMSRVQKLRPGNQ